MLPPAAVGFSVACSSLRRGRWNVGGKFAIGNHGLGVDAGFAIDATGASVLVNEGGNVARRNLPPQCTGVVCTPN